MYALKRLQFWIDWTLSQCTRNPLVCHMQHKQYFKKQDRFETCFKNRRMWFAFGHFWWVIGWVNKKCGSSFFGFCKFNVNVFVWSVIQLMGNGNLN